MVRVYTRPAGSRLRVVDEARGRCDAPDEETGYD
jgi:hypothetical protein